MVWTIQRICLREDSVYLLKENTSVVRQISVPGAESTSFENGHLMIRFKTGFCWSVNPETGSRRRFQVTT